jgi:hypothetical protein
MGNKSDKKSWMDGTPEFMRTVPIMFDKERNELERSKIFYRIPTTGMVVDEKTEGAIAYRRFWGYVSTPEVDFYNTVVARDAVIEAWLECTRRLRSERFLKAITSSEKKAFMLV